MQNRKRKNSFKEANISDSSMRAGVGFPNCSNLSAVFFSGATYVAPIAEVEDVEGDIKKIRYDWSANISQMIHTTSLYGNDWLYDFNVRDHVLELGEPTMLRFECHLLQNRKGTPNEVLNQIKNDIKPLVNNLEEMFVQKGYALSAVKKINKSIKKEEKTQNLLAD